MEKTESPWSRLLTSLLTFSAAAVALYAALPLFGKGFIPTHDGEYHIIRFWQFYAMLSSGYWFPRWAPDLNSGYGIPLFTFHYPFPNYVGTFFHSLGFSFVDSFKLVLAGGYLSAVLMCFLWLKKLFGHFSAAIGSIVFATVPYWFVDIYVRGSVGEVIAISWFFLALSAIEHNRAVLLSISTALLILSHNIMGFMLVPILFLYLWIRSRRLWLGLVVGILVSAYFWMPALFEGRFVTGLNVVNFRDHFPELFQLLVPSWGTGFSRQELASDEMSFQIGIIPIIVILFGAMKLGRANPVARFFAVLFVIATALMLRISEPVWNALPFLQLFQYPWRLLVLVLPISAFFAGWIAQVHKWWVGTLIAIASVLLSLSYVRPVIYMQRSDAYYLSKPEFTGGTSSLGNTFSTIWTEWKRDRPEEKIETEGSVQIINLNSKPLRYEFDVDASSIANITVNTLYYPGWRVVVDGKREAIDYQENGIIEFSVPAGRHSVLVYLTETTARKVADVVSLVGLAAILVLGYTSRKYAYRNKHDGAVWRA